MKKLLLVGVASLIVQTGFAIDSSKQLKSGFLVKTSIDYNASGKNAKAEKEFIVAERSDWVTLTENEKGVQVLGRIIRANRETVQIETLILDTQKKPNGVISTPQIVARYGEPAQVAIQSGDYKFSLNLLANKTEYASDELSSSSAAPIHGSSTCKP